MQNISDQEKYKKLKTLPLLIRRVIADPETPLIVKKVGQKANLHIDQIGDLSDEVALTLLGFTRREDFLNHLKNRLGIDQGLAEKMTKELDEKIFAPIKNELRQTETLTTPTQDIAKPTNNQTQNTKEMKFEPIKRGVDLEEVKFKVPTPNYSGQSMQKDEWGEIEHKNTLMKEIENPKMSPFKGEGVVFSKDDDVKNSGEIIKTNLEEKGKNVLFESPIVRTMQTDMTRTEMTQSQGQKNTDEKPLNNLSDHQTIIPKTLIPNDQTQIRGKFGSGTIPVNLPTGNIPSNIQTGPTPPPTPTPKEKPPLNKTQIPSVKKSYVVDPYREPTE